MQDPTPAAAAGGLLAKLLPAGAGAALMCCVDPPITKRELFARIFVAMLCAYLFGDTVLDFLHSFSMLSFLDAAKHTHQVSIDALVGAFGWTMLGAVSMYSKKFRADPDGTLAATKKEFS